MKALPPISSAFLIASFLITLSPIRESQGAADPPKEKTDSNGETSRPSKGGKKESRRESMAQKEISEALEKTRAELEKTRDSLHEAHKELGSKTETISTLEANLSSVSAQLEKAKAELKKASSAAGTVAKQERQLEANRKKIADLQGEIKTLAQEAATAITAAKNSARQEKPSKAMASSTESTKKSPQTSKDTVIAPISYLHASAVNYPERDRALKEVVTALKKSPKARVEITGHADDSRYEETNRDVSTNRAKFLAAYFVINGVPEEKIVVKGLGNSEALKGEANRRVEISILP